MKKAFLIFTLGLLPMLGYSQFKIGIKVDPSISLTRLRYEDREELFSGITDGGPAKANLNISLFADIQILEHVAFNVGLGLRHSAVRFSYRYEGDSTFSKQEMDVRLQYLQLPVGVKLFTNDITNRMRAYVGVGTELGIRLAEEQNDLDEDYEDFVAIGEDFTKWFDANLKLAIGVEYRVGKSNIAFAGLEYGRGLINLVSSEYLKIDNEGEDNDASLNNDNLDAYTDQIRLVLGFKF